LDSPLGKRCQRTGLGLSSTRRLVELDGKMISGEWAGKAEWAPSRYIPPCSRPQTTQGEADACDQPRPTPRPALGG
jgi:hypothetical protein